jgi:hypothetical protein
LQACTILLRRSKDNACGMARYHSCPEFRPPTTIG